MHRTLGKFDIARLDVVYKTKLQIPYEQLFHLSSRYATANLELLFVSVTIFVNVENYKLWTTY